MTHSERRNHLRYRTHLDARILTPDKNIFGVVTDIGKAGIGMNSETSVSTGTRVFICMDLPETAVVHGIVVWALDTRTERSRPHMIGVEILSVILPARLECGYEDKTELTDGIISMISDAGGKIEPK